MKNKVCHETQPKTLHSPKNQQAMTPFLFMLALLLTLSLPSLAFAAATPAQNDEALSIRLISNLDAAGETAEALLGLDVTLADGWHTYWRSPGATGAPPVLDWAKAQNVKSATLLYPTPHRATLFGIDAIGYMDHLVFPIRVTKQDASGALDITLGVDILVCKEMCLPKHFDFALHLPAGQGKPDSETALLEEAMRKLPATTSSRQLAITNVSRTTNKVYVAIASDTALAAPDLVIETPKSWSFSKPDVTIDPDKHKAILIAELESRLPEGQSLAATPLTLTLLNNGASLELAITQDGAVPASSPSTSPITPLPFWSFALFALLGGFILNLMPCVLPVLSLKVLSVIKHGGNGHDKIRRSFLSTGTGIVFSFILLACGTIAIKTGGQVIGWGVQFQQPAFLIFMVTMLTLFTANLWGFFEITLPRFLMDSLDSSHHPKLAGDFATGILATLLATPCSAPFLGTAIGFALSQGPIQILGVFTMLGIGMAAPYFAIALYPALASSLPKPGAWMNSLTRILGFGLAGTAAWLLLVLHKQIGTAAMIAVTVGMLLILLQLFLRHKNILQRAALPVIALVFMGAMALGLVATLPEAVSPEAGVWEKFDEDSLARHVREGKTVFLDITADWCITCKANKRFTLARDEVAKKIFESKDVIAMQGNWTNPDPLITAFLQKHGRYGIPFNAVYGPNAPEGVLLPELLTPSDVLKAIEEAKGRSRVCPTDLPKGKDC